MIIQLLTHYTKSHINKLCDISRCNTQSNLSKINRGDYSELKKKLGLRRLQISQKMSRLSIHSIHTSYIRVK